MKIYSGIEVKLHTVDRGDWSALSLEKEVLPDRKPNGNVSRIGTDSEE
jgi:hypothetical protein